MSNWIFLAEEKKDLDWLNKHGFKAIHVDDYLTGLNAHGAKKNSQVINLCRSSKYLSIGYYASLLAEARGHKNIPSVRTQLDVSRKGLIRLRSELLESSRIKKLLDAQALKIEGQTRFELNVYFGGSVYSELNEIARLAFDEFPAPMLKVIFKRRSVKEWALDDVRLMSIAKLPKEEERFFIERLTRFITQRKRKTRTKAPARFDLAILVNPEEKLAPSDEGAIKKFERIGKSMGLYIERIERKDYQRISEFDALFIRETTGLNHYTYRFAKKAEAEGLVVIDDPQSILRCTNKVFLAELLNINHLPTPKTVIAGPQDLNSAEKMIGYPMVLKIPDGSFSRGVEKANNREELETIAKMLFEQSELILAQEFLYTEYDWRIGILNGRPLFACQYFMSKKNWKIVEHKADGKVIEGGFKTMPVDQAPPDVVATALAAANLIGDGLYGVDMKQTAKGPVIIEVNDNPNLDAGIEDKYLKDQLYREVLGEFMRRLEIRALSQR